MNIKELEKVIKSENIPSDCYSIMKGGLPNETYCLVSENNNWIVYYSERGNRSGLKKFKNESEACKYFYEQIKKYGNK